MDPQEAARAALERRITQYERQVAAIYREALAEMRDVMQSVYDSYATDGVLTRAQMTQYNRMATTEAQLLAITTDADRQALAIIDRLHPDEYQAGFFRSAWAIDQTTGLRLAWGLVDPNMAREVLDNPFFRDAVWRYSAAQRATTSRLLATGMVRGKSYDRMARDLARAVNITAGRANRIIRTEGHAAQAAGTTASHLLAQEEGVVGNDVWIATLDGDTRPTHQAMDQQPRGEDGLFNGPGFDRAAYPGDPNISAGERINCRCDVGFRVEGYAPQLRRSRDEGLVPYQTYEQWASPDRLHFG